MSPAVYIVQPQALFIPELSRIVAAAGGHVTRFAESVEVEELAALRADYAIVDLDYTVFGVSDGLALFRTLAPSVRTIVLTETRDFAELDAYRAAGAVAVVSKAMHADELRDSLRELFARDEVPAARIEVLRSETIEDDLLRQPQQRPAV